jgi:hypothetical protein
LHHLQTAQVLALGTSHREVADVNLLSREIEPELGDLAPAGLEVREDAGDQMHALLGMALLDGHADDPARASEDLRQVLVTEVADSIVRVDEGELDRQGVEHRRQHLGGEIGRKVLHRAELLDGRRERRVADLSVGAERGFHCLDARHDLLRVGLGEHAPAQRIQDVILLPVVALEQLGVRPERGGELGAHRAVSLGKAIRQRDQGGEHLLGLLVLVEHHRQRATVSRNAALFEQREEVALLLLVVAAVRELGHVFRERAHELWARSLRAAQGVVDRLEHALDGLVIVHQ